MVTGGIGRNARALGLMGAGAVVVALLGGCDPAEQAGTAPGSTSTSSATRSTHAAGVVPGHGTATSTATSTPAATHSPTSQSSSLGALVPVLSVIDGDTIAVRIDGVRRKIRLIGVDTPETRKPNTPVQCFGKQASSEMQSLVQSRSVRLQADPSQGDVDKYGRSLRYVFTADGRNVAQTLIAGGFGREYTYDTAYRYQAPFRAAESAARRTHAGLWGACPSFGSPVEGSRPSTSPAPAPVAPSTPVPAAPADCRIKGNINSKGEKIYHLPGSATYDKTVITPSKGERYFCSEAAAVAAGWRAAQD
ncbi:thermonuclease family protein [Allobranchiibius sp. CTAmp26]|uniref:thermonuclease family protein n=1 Tax=Allobranchiibius sp. CTAmp26 TaxID=2815214 RepID=UPI0027DB6902|nr:thermonuclease family protein [Allobranchiibius sp. CTAmp26]